jgi:hypothetical protein
MTLGAGGGVTGGLPVNAAGLTGNETFNFDNPIAAATGQNPSTGAVNINILGQSVSDPTNFRNLFRGGDFSINPFARANTPTTISGNITTTPTYQADGFVGWGGTSRQMTMQGVAIAPSTAGVPAQFSRALAFASTAAQTGAVPVAIGQILETAIATRLQGQTVTLSFWAQALAGFSGIGSNLVVSGLAGTGTDQGSGSALTSQFSGGITATAAATSWTNAVSLIPTPLQLAARSVVTPVNPSAQSLVNPQPALWAQSQGAFQNGVNVPISTTWARYSVTFTVPTLQAGAAITEVGFALGWKTVGTTGITDGINLAGVQLEVDPVASPFEFIDPASEALRCARHALALPLVAAAGVQLGLMYGISTTAGNLYQQFPVPMRAIPTFIATGTTTAVNLTTAGATGSALTFSNTGQGTNPPTQGKNCGYIGITGATTVAAGSATAVVTGASDPSVALWQCEL